MVVGDHGPGAAGLGVPLVVVAGGPGARSTAAVLREFEEQLAILADDANRQGVRLLLEPLHPALTHLSVLTSLREAGRIAARHPNVGVVLDSWHVWSEPDLVETVGKHAERIDVVHLADWRPGPFTERRALPGAGVMDLAALGDALRDVLADAWWELEVIDEDAADRDAQRQLLRGAVHAARAGGLFSEGTCASPSSAARPAARAH